MREETKNRIERAVEAVRTSKDGCGQVVIVLVKGRVTHIKNNVIEAISEDNTQKPKT